MENRNGATLNENGDRRTMVEELEVNGEGVADVMRMLMEERQRREAEREEERRKWEMEMRMRDEEMARRGVQPKTDGSSSVSSMWSTTAR